MPASERAALITGGSGGIGLAVARALGAEGYRLTVSARRPKRLQAAVEQLDAEGFTAHSVPAELAREDDVLALVGRHRELHGRLDVLVNNAGTGAVQAIEAIKTRLLDKQLAVNFRAIALCTREALPMLRVAGSEHGKALIVNVASISARAGHADIPVYAATKAAVISFTHSTQREVRSAGIQCTALAPGLVDTPLADYARHRLPGEAMIRPEDIGQAVRFLLRLSPACHVAEIDFTRPGVPSSAAL